VLELFDPVHVEGGLLLGRHVGEVVDVLVVMVVIVVVVVLGHWGLLSAAVASLGRELEPRLLRRYSLLAMT
jgi:hypothetical protein